MFKCEVCEKEFKTKRRLRDHIAICHPDQLRYRCEICGRGSDKLSSLLCHITKCHKEICIENYYNEYLFGKIKCKYCDEILPYKRYSGSFCNLQHYQSYNKKESIKYKCEICHVGYETKGGLRQHLGSFHPDINIEKYYIKYLMLKEELDCCKYCGKKLKFHSFTEGYKNFCYNKDCNVRWYNENTDRDKRARKSIITTYKNDKTISPRRIEHWIKKGYNEIEAREKLKNYQTTFSKDICIKKYGKEAGLKRWQERQAKWLKNFPKQNYSNVSQELFWEIYKMIKCEYKNIYFATLFNGNKIENKNKEFRLKTNKTTRSLDFYIDDINKCIEFDGTYWHGIIGRGNRTRDDLRDVEINERGIDVFHVKEMDYNKDSKRVINECMEFINGTKN